MSNSVPKSARASVQFWLMAVFLTIIFATGGSSRNDVQSLAILYPVSIIFCALALSTLRIEHLSKNRSLLGGFGAVVMMALVHLIPMPSGIWMSAFGSTDLVSLQPLSGVVAEWRPLTPVPANGWQAAISLATPLAIILLGIQLGKAGMLRLQPVLIGLASVSGLIGLLQIVGDPNGPLYFYRTTNNGSAVGLFANRNHAATLLGCLFPMLAVYASTAGGSADGQRSRQLWCIAIATVAVPLILITGSRSGLLSGIIGLAGAALLYSSPEHKHDNKAQITKKRFASIPVIGGIVVFALGLLTYLFARAEAVERLFFAVSDQNRRADFIVVSTDLFWKYYPLGTGSGSFAEMYQLVEPLDLLNPKRLNRAHNDWIEIAVTYGIPGLILLALFVGWYARQVYRLWRYGDSSRQSVKVARMAALAIAMIALASLSDYPLRTPIMMSFSAVLVLWFTNGSSKPKQMPN